MGRACIQSVFCSLIAAVACCSSWRTSFESAQEILVGSSFIATAGSMVGILLPLQKSMKIYGVHAIRLNAAGILASATSSFGAFLAPIFSLVGAVLSVFLIVNILKISGTPVMDILYQQRHGHIYLIDFFRPLFFPLEVICDNLIIIIGQKHKVHMLHLPARTFFSPFLNGLFLLVFFRAFNSAYAVLSTLLCSVTLGWFLNYCSRAARLHKYINFYSTITAMGYISVLIFEINNVTDSLVRARMLSRKLAELSILAPAIVTPTVVVQWYFGNAGFRRISYFSVLFSTILQQHLITFILSIAHGPIHTSLAVPKQSLQLSIGCSALVHLLLAYYTRAFNNRLLKELSPMMAFLIVMYYGNLAIL